jgi:hypothetical protein
VLVETLVAARLVLAGHRLPATRVHLRLRPGSPPAGSADLA